jgi:hypothetical protein
LVFEPVNVGTIQEFVTMGKLVPKANALITMKDLQDAGVVGKLATGVKLLGTVRVLPECGASRIFCEAFMPFVLAL